MDRVRADPRPHGLRDLERHPTALRDSVVRSWLRLVRAPNLPTAIADVLAGAALASAPLATPAAFVPALGSAALYAGGVALNDAFDVEKDRALHPERVLPSGYLKVSAAKVGGFLLLALGVLSGLPQGPAGIVAAAVLAALIVVYDVLPDGAGVLGAVALGLCRAANLFRGSLAGRIDAGEIAVFCALHFALVLCITAVSLGENRRTGRLGNAALAVLPFCYAGPAIAAFHREDPVLGVIVIVLCAQLALWVVRPAYRAEPDRNAVVPRAVFTITLLGALYCAATREWIGAAVLVLLFGVSRLSARLLAQRGS